MFSGLKTEVVVADFDKSISLKGQVQNLDSSDSRNEWEISKWN